MHCSPRLGFLSTLGSALLGALTLTGCEATIVASGGSGGGGGATSASTTASTATSTSASTSTGGSITNEEACAEHAKAICGRRDSCTNGFLTARDYGDLATCESRQAAECLLRLDAPGTSADAASVAACASALETFACGDLLNAALPSACGPKPGAVANGGACAFGGQCASTFCQSATSDACGVCAVPPVAGNSCAEDTGCGAGTGLKCATGKGICVVPGPVGAACEEAADCRNELSCVVPTAGMPGTCQTAGATVGAACDGQAQIAPDCDRNQGLRCAMGQCAALTFADAGEPCGAMVGAVCSANGACVGPSGAKACVAAVADGQACDTEAGPSCQAPAHCYGDGVSTAGVCALNDAAACM